MGISLGDVSVVANASAPYSVVAVMLAGTVLKEHLAPGQGLGVVVAILVGVVVLGLTVSFLDLAEPADVALGDAARRFEGRIVDSGHTTHHEQDTRRLLGYLAVVRVPVGVDCESLS